MGKMTVLYVTLLCVLLNIACTTNGGREPVPARPRPGPTVPDPGRPEVIPQVQARAWIDLGAYRGPSPLPGHQPGSAQEA